MLTHLLFSISALIIMVIFIITYFAYKKKTNSIRSKIYAYMISCALVLTIVEIIEGITYVYNVSIIFSLMWKLHSIIMIIFVALLFYYFLATVDDNIYSVEDLFWDKKKLFSIRNLFTILFIVMIILSTLFIKTYTMGLTMFYFYTNQSIKSLLLLYLVYILYNGYIVYLKSINNSFETNDYILLIGTFLLFVSALFFEYIYSEISIYSTLFTLVLILIYYFKENEDLILIEELKKYQIDLSRNNELGFNYLNELLNDLENPIKSFNIINDSLSECSNLTDEELKNDCNSLNYISKSLVNILNNHSSNRLIKYRIDKLVKNIEEVIKPMIRDKKIQFSYTIDQNIPSLLEGDYKSIHRIITGLIVNAISYTEVGRIILNITCERRKNDVILNIKVSDTGRGIKREDFDKVYTNNNTCNMALIKNNIEALNGKIMFDSNYGSGSIFYVNLPQLIANESSLGNNPITNEEIIPNDCNKKKVLIIDNEFYSSDKLSKILSKYNLDVECINSGLDAVNVIKCGGDYKLILINENIKDGNYIDIGKLLKYLNNIINMPPLVALIVNEDLNKIQNIFDDYLLKPINLKKLDEIIKRRCI